MEPCMWLPDRFTFCWCTQWTLSDVWSQLATTPQCSFTIGYRQSQKKWRNCDRRVICNATRRFGAGRGVVCHRGGSDGSDGARPLWWSNSARTEMFFADAPGGRSWVVGSGGHIVAEIIMSINITVWTISLLCPPQWDLAMPHSYGIDNHKYRFSRKSRKLDCRTQMFWQNLLPAASRL